MSTENNVIVPENPLLIQNTAGQWEQETQSRRSNLIEAVVVMAAIQICFWAIWFPLEIAYQGTSLDNLGEDIAIGILGVLLIFIVLRSPFKHRDTLKAWGLGDPRYVINQIRHGNKKIRGFFIGFLLFLIIVLIVVFILIWPDIAHYLFKTDKTAAKAFEATPTGIVLIIVLAIVLALFLGLFVIRYDNFLHALKVALVVCVILCVPLLLFALGIAYATNTPIQINPANFIEDFAGYIFYGAAQQLLFASYFGTRFRKAFTPTRELPDPAHTTSKEERGLWKKRIVVSLLSGSFFGLIHIPAWTLMAFTMILGFVISWLYMKDGNRNLLAIGVIHGLGGTMANELFTGAPIKFSVGPSSVPAVTVPWMWLVEIFVAVLLIAICLIWRYYEKHSNAISK